MEECPYLEKGNKAVCAASISLLAPTVEDEESYCLTEEHYRCPMLLSHVLRRGSARPKRLN
ncbi:MAG TPA: hypothetical protein DDW94_06120 [Deltaproteobacteria bacterium]|nr:MAG: hypothetical protein A2Z79_00650 [Deltaproteobacteria bacterium GWA2_55_82]OGQ64887.1 MAG: hypothetical protein A3I81_04760 [Deltaproteobacteria bacterium RIFCSPLOWO2_02_FULL_55_12]OIJ73954.1 MAG: hypothetical protein A2V21_306555 [Deltaproteobacteria bacterium GWC2_55_46]HBG46552.1 hypothetical protein [Deltaproteobacteria bacterium]HCY09954.1 hypothetical protein [Deltaproteobacteria bacterium]